MIWYASWLGSLGRFFDRSGIPQVSTGRGPESSPRNFKLTHYQILKQGRLQGALEDYYASPIGADGKVYILSQGGKGVVLKATGDWEILAINDLEDECYATPAVVDGHIYLRTRHTLYCFKKKSPAE